MKKAQESVLIPWPHRHSGLAWSSNLICAVCPASKIYRQHPPLIETKNQREGSIKPSIVASFLSKERLDLMKVCSGDNSRRAIKANFVTAYQLKKEQHGNCPKACSIPCCQLHKSQWINQYVQPQSTDSSFEVSPLILEDLTNNPYQHG
jgi:hypothetical protein